MLTNIDMLLTEQDVIVLLRNTIMQWRLLLSSTAMHRYHMLVWKTITQRHLAKALNIWRVTVRDIWYGEVLDYRLKGFQKSQKNRLSRAYWSRWSYSAFHSAQLEQLQQRVLSAVDAHKRQSVMQQTSIASREMELHQTGQLLEFTKQMLASSSHTIEHLQASGLARLSRALRRKCLHASFALWRSFESSDPFSGPALLDVTIPEPSICSPAIASGLMAVAFSVELSHEGTEHLHSETSFVQQLKVDIERLLQAPRGSVQVLYRQPADTSLELILSRRDIDTGFEYCSDDLGSNPAEVLKACVDDPSSLIHSAPAARLIRFVEVHGEIAFGVAKEISRGMRACEQSLKVSKEVEQTMHERARGLQTDLDRLGAIVQRTNARAMGLRKTILNHLRLKHLRRAFLLFARTVCALRDFDVLCRHKTAQNERARLVGGFGRWRLWRRSQRFSRSALVLLTSLQRQKLLSAVIRGFGSWNHNKKLMHRVLSQMSQRMRSKKKKELFASWRHIAVSLAAESRQASVVSIKYELDFDGVIGDPTRKEEFQRQLVHDVGTSLGVATNTLLVLAYHRGSIIVQVAFLPGVRDSHDSRDSRRPPAQLAREMVLQANASWSTFRNTSTGRSVKCAHEQGAVDPGMLKGLVEAQTSQGQVEPSSQGPWEDILCQNIEELMRRNMCDCTVETMLQEVSRSFSKVEDVLSASLDLLHQTNLSGSILSLDDTNSRSPQLADALAHGRGRYETPSEQVARESRAQMLSSVSSEAPSSSTQSTVRHILGDRHEVAEDVRRLKALMVKNNEAAVRDLLLQRAETGRVQTDLSVALLDLEAERSLSTSLRADLSKMRFDLDSAHMSEADMAVRVARSDARNLELHRKLDAMQTASTAMELCLQHLRAKVEVGHENMALLQNSVEVVRDKMKKDLGYELEALSQSLSDALEVARSSCDESQQLYKDKQVLLQQNRDLKVEVGADEKQIRELQQNVMALQHEKRRATDKVSTLEADAAANMHDRWRLEAQVAILAQDLEVAPIKAEQAAASVAVRHEHEISRLNREKSMLTSNIGQLQSEQQALRQSLRQSSAAGAEVASKLLQEQNKTRVLQAEKDSSTAKLKAAEHNAVELQASLFQLREQKVLLVDLAKRHGEEAADIGQELVKLRCELERCMDATLHRAFKVQTDLKESLCIATNEKTQLNCSLQQLQRSKDTIATTLSIQVQEGSQRCADLESKIEELLSDKLRLMDLQEQANRKFVSENEALTGGLADALEVARTSTLESQQLSREKQILADEKKMVQDERIALQVELEATKRESLEAARDMSNLLKDLEQYQERLTCAVTEMGGMRSEIERLEGEKELLTVEHEGCKRMVSSLQSNMNGLVQDLAEYQELLEAERSDSSAVREGKENMSVQIHGQRQDSDHCHTALHGAIARLKQELSQQAAQVQVLQVLVSQKTAEAETARDSNSDLQAELQELRGRTDALVREKHAAEQERDFFARELQMLVQSPVTATGGQRSASEIIDLQVGEVAALVAKRKTATEMERKLCDSLKTDIAELQAKLSDAKAGMRSAKAEVVGMAREKEQLLAEAEARCEILEDDFRQLQARYYEMDEKYQAAQVRLDMLNSGVEVMSESHANLEHALQTEVSSGNLVYQELQEALLQKELEVAHSIEDAALKTRALTKWAMAFRHRRVCRGIAAHRAHGKKIHAKALIWQCWVLFWKQNAKMISRQDYWQEKKVIAKRRALQRLLCACFRIFRCHVNNTYLQIDAVRRMARFRGSRVLVHVLYSWHTFVRCYKSIGFVPRPSRLARDRLKSLLEAGCAIAALMSRHVAEKLCAYTSMRRASSLVGVLEAWNIVIKANRIENAVVQRVIERAGANQGRRRVKSAILHWRKVGTTSAVAQEDQAKAASGKNPFERKTPRILPSAGSKEEWAWSRFLSKLLAQCDSHLQLAASFKLHGRCRRLQHALSDLAAGSHSKILLLDAISAWSQFAKQAARGLSEAQKDADYLSAKSQLLDLQAHTQKLEAQGLKRELQFNKLLRVAAGKSAANGLAAAFIAMHTFTRWRSHVVVFVARLREESCLYTLASFFWHWRLVAVLSRKQSCQEALEMERLSVNTLAQWHAQARFEQDSQHVVLAQVTTVLSNLAEEHRTELRALHTHLRSHLQARNEAVDSLLGRLECRRAKKLGFASLMRNVREMARAKRKTMARRTLAGWRQVWPQPPFLFSQRSAFACYEGRCD